MINLLVNIHLWSQALQLQWVILGALSLWFLWALVTVRLNNG